MSERFESIRKGVLEAIEWKKGKRTGARVRKYTSDVTLILRKANMIHKESMPFLNSTIKDALSTLTPREEQILRMRFGIGHETTHTLDKIGRHFNLTGERIRQIEKKALEKLEYSEVRNILINSNKLY